MVINQLKTKFNVINGTPVDKKTIFLRDFCDLAIKYTDTYIYLGSPITDDAKLNTAISIQADMCQKQLSKLIVFLDNQNRDLSFKYKKVVMDACFFSTITYAGENWLGGNLRPLETMYNRAIKCLLGVRATTCMDMCLLELNYPSLQTMLL